MYISFILPFSVALLTVLIIVTLRLLHVLYIRPYLQLQPFKNSGGVLHYSASGLISKFRNDERVHCDYFHLLRAATKENPKHRFVVANVGTSLRLFIRDSKLIEAYLASQSLYKNPVGLEVFSSLFPTSTLVAQGAIWQAHRISYKSILSSKFIDQMIPMVFDTTLEYISFVDPMKSTLDAGTFCKTIVGEILARLFFGKRLRNFKLENGMTLANMFLLMTNGALEAGTGLIAALFGSKVVLKGYHPEHRRLISSVHLFKKFILNQAKERKKFRDQKKNETSGEEFTLLDALFDHQRNNLETIIDAEIFDEFVSFFIAGLETTSQIATMCIYEMAKDNELRNELLKEATILFKEQAKFNLTKLNLLEYLDALIKESMRVNPPFAFSMSRQAKETHFLDDVQIPKGTHVQIGILQNQINPDNYKDAEIFDPSRWIKGSQRFQPQAEGKHNYTFCPYSVGSRKCIGELLSKTVCKIILMCFVKRFDFRLDVRTAIVMTASPVYQPANQVLLSIRRGSFAN